MRLLDPIFTFKEKMTKLCVQLFEVGLVEHKRRQAEVNSFFSSNAKATTDIKQKEKQILEEFEEHLREVNKTATVSDCAWKNYRDLSCDCCT